MHVEGRVVREYSIDPGHNRLLLSGQTHNRIGKSVKVHYKRKLVW